MSWSNSGSPMILFDTGPPPWRAARRRGHELMGEGEMSQQREEERVQDQPSPQPLPHHEAVILPRLSTPRYISIVVARCEETPLRHGAALLRQPGIDLLLRQPAKAGDKGRVGLGEVEVVAAGADVGDDVLLDSHRLQAVCFSRRGRGGRAGGRAAG